jgi:cell division protease FtsH
VNGKNPLFKAAQGSPNWKRMLLILLLWMIVFSFFLPSHRKNQLSLSYTDFKKRVRQNQVSEITFKGKEIYGKFKKPVEAPGEKGKAEKNARKFSQFTTVLPSIQDPDLMPVLEKNGVNIRAELNKRSWFWTLLIYVLPWVLIIGFFVYSSRKFQERMGGKGGIFGFAKSKAKLYTRSTSNVTFEDVADLENAKRELLEVVGFLKDPSKYSSLGGELPRGILLVGPPGVGKTLMARAVAGEAEVPFYSISGSEFIEMFVGVGASRVRDMFGKAKKEAPAIIFIDELDSIGRARGTGFGGGHDEREQTLNQILSEMDGFSPHESVVVISATNRPDVLDPALIRPGRFDRQVTVDLPQREARHAILEIHTREVPLAGDVDLENVAARTVGFSGAQLKNVVNEAALLAARKNRKEVGMEEFDQARDKILMGIEREDVINEEEKEAIAYHEAGHVMVTRSIPGADPLEKVSIIPRGRALGATEQIPQEDRHNLNRNYLLGRVAIMLGGRAAEKTVFGDLSSGAGDDLKNATELARRMVCQWGMSEKLGPVAFHKGDSHPFLGREMAEPKDFSEHTARLIDEEIRKILSDMESRAEEILGERRDQLDALARLLMEHETLSKEEIDEALGGDPKEGTQQKSGQ